jgi:hypothetical protein
MIASTPPADRLPDAAEPPTYDHVPFIDPHPSCGSISIVSGDTSVTLWGGHETAPEFDGQVQLQLAPDRPVVIGRYQGHQPPYLDPAYRPTQLMPGTGRPVVRSESLGPDVWVSRAHFMLRGAAGGIVLTNGVPRAGGGIRPPTNRTWLWETNWRLMQPGEEYLIGHGSAVSLRLPNGTVVQICAE